MSKYYEKSVGNGEKFLYDSSGKCIGRGVTDNSGRTIYSGSGGYVGKSYETGHGVTKHYDSDNNYVGSGFTHSTGSTIIGNDNKSSVHTNCSTSNSHSSSASKPEGEGCMVTLGCVFILGLIYLFLKLLYS